MLEPLPFKLFEETDGSMEPIDQMLKYLRENFGNRQGINAEERGQLAYYREEIARLKQGLPADLAGNSTASEKMAESSSDSEVEEVEDLPVIAAKPSNRGPRTSVSAEVFGKFNSRAAFQPPKHAKSADDEQAITDKMSGNFLFASLNPADKQAVIDAFFAKKFKAGDTVI